MELKDYTEEQLKAELKRRVELRKAQKGDKYRDSVPVDSTVVFKE